MSVKKVDIAGVGVVTLVKSTRNKNLRLTVNAGAVRVSMPRWSPYAAGAAFAAKNQAWIARELSHRQVAPLEQGQAIGKQHSLNFIRVFKQKSRLSHVSQQEVTVYIRPGETDLGAGVQKRARQAALRALKSEAQALLAPRVSEYAQKHGFMYGNVSVKTMKRRWGSCSSERNLTFNAHLMALPWELIDYVIFHELTHTRHMHHGPAFWQAMETVLPDARARRKAIREFQPGSVI